MSDDRLDSWKAISVYLKRDVTTVQRWEKREGMPVHRHLHDKLGSVYAFRSELDAWMNARKTAPAIDPGPEAPVPSARRPAVLIGLAVAAVLLLAGVALWQTRPAASPSANPLERAEFRMITDFDGAEQAAAVSRDGKLIAFTSDRDGSTDVWITQVGTGQFHNLTRKRVQQLVNPSVRTLGFSPDSAFVTFWARGVEGATADDIGIWAIPVLGGQPKPYLEGVAEFDWSRDGSRVTYHTPGPGDPMFVGATLQRTEGRQIFAAASGLHAHFPSWSPAGDYIYFVQGSVPDAMDIWRIKPTGQDAEQMTRHNSAVSHPILLSDRTLMYLADVGDGNGPRLHTMDVRDRVAHALGTGLDRFTSLEVSEDGRRIVATRANPKATLWRMPIGGAAGMSLVSLPTGRGFSPRLGPDYLIYVAQKGTGDDAIWKLIDGVANELWSAPGARVMGGAAISRDGGRVAFSVAHGDKTSLYAMNSDGTGVQVVTDALALRGAPAWAPDGRSIVSGATMNGAAHLVRVELDGRTVSVIPGFAVDPVWSPGGGFIVYTAADIGTEFPVNASTATGQPHAIPKLTLTRGARRLRFSSDGRSLLTMRGDIRHKDVWVVDLATGKERQLTHLPADFNIRDFDLSADGSEILLEREQDHSDIVLIELPAGRR